MSDEAGRELEPQPGDDWAFRLPHMKAKRTKTVGSVSVKTFLVESGSSETVDLPYVNWQRENKGRYSGVTVRRLMEFGRRVSTKAERDAHLKAQIEKAKQKRKAKLAASDGTKEQG